MRKISLKVALISMMILVTLVAMLLFNAAYGNLTSKAFTQLDLELVTQNLTGAKDKLDSVLNNAKELTHYTTQNVLTQEDFSPERFVNRLDPLITVDGSISSIVLYNRTGAPICATSKTADFLYNVGVHDQPWFTDALENDDLMYTNARLEGSYHGDYTWVVTLTQPVSYTSRGFPAQGLLAVNLRLSAIGNICDGFMDDGNGYLTLKDSAGNVIYSPRTKLLNLKKISDVYAHVGTRSEEVKQLEISQPLINENWILVSTTLENEAGNGQRSLQRNRTLMLLLSLSIALLMAWVLAEIMARPFAYMEHTMDRIDNGVSGVRLKPRGFKEFARMSVKYNIMIDKIESLMTETEQKQEQLRKLEIATLEEQINPHFLYNALDSITWLVETGRNPDAVKMIGALARLLRLSINRGGNFHSVENEIEHIHNYLIIQKTRYGQRFESHIHVEKEAESLICPRLILQPIVENAIKHGIADNTDCRIIVRVWLEDGSLRISVWDDGMGIVPQRLVKVQHALKESMPPPVDEFSGLALKSINRRIRLLCGEPYGLSIDSETEEWTCVQITLPLKQSL